MWFFNKKKKDTLSQEDIGKVINQSNLDDSAGSSALLTAKILVAEDEQDLREVLTDKLEASGFTVLQAVNGDEAIKLAFSNHPDLILLDLYMPKSSGFDVMDKLIDDPWGREVPVIVLTNRGDFTSKKKLFSLKHLTYLIKAETGLDELVGIVKTKLITERNVDKY